MDKGRSRIRFITLVFLVMGLGLGSRALSAYMPQIVNLYLGDVFWALMIFLIMGFIFRRSSTVFTATSAILFSYAIEFSQLYQEPWINALRKTTLGALVLGFGFLWSDLLAYTFGIGIGVFLEKYWLLRK